MSANAAGGNLSIPRTAVKALYGSRVVRRRSPRESRIVSALASRVTGSESTNTAAAPTIAPVRVSANRMCSQVGAPASGARNVK